MKRFNKYTVLFIALSLGLTAKGQSNEIKSNENKFASYSQRELNLNEYRDIYSRVPATLGLWNNGNFSYISLGYDFTNGNFRDRQGYSQRGAVNIGTESIQRLGDSWIFHGKFGYLNGVSKDVKMNLSYRKSQNQSPYYYFMEMPGDWSFQSYLFEGSAVKELVKDKLFAGASINYYSHLNFRTVDYRNEQYDLEIRVNPSLTYKVSSANFISLTGIFTREKSEPEIYSKYQQSNAGDEYQLYINAGLGTYIKNAPQSTTKLINNRGATLGWHNRAKEQQTNIILTYESEEELWSNKLTSSISALGENLVKYNNQRYGINLFSHLKLNKEREIRSEIGASIIKGEGEKYNNDIKLYEKNFTVTDISAEIKESYISKNSQLSRIFVSGSFNYHREFDMNYGQKFSYTNLNLSAGADYNVKSIKSLTIQAQAGIKKNLDHLHDPLSAAENIVTKKIIYSNLSFNTADLFFVNTNLIFSRAIYKDYLADIILYGTIFKPTTINIPDPLLTFTKSDNRLSCGVRIVFNF